MNSTVKQLLHLTEDNKDRKTEKMTLTPDQRLAQDVGLGFLVCVLMMMFTAYLLTIEFDEASYCAEKVQRSISPYQRKLLISSDTFEHSYEEIKTWCDNHPLDWKVKLQSAKTFPEFPLTPDMIR